MAAVLRDSVLYTKLHVNKYPGLPTERAGRFVPIPFEVTFVSPSTVADTYNLCVIPSGCRVVGLNITTSGSGASAGAGRTIALGDSGDNDRYMVATDFDVANAQGSLATTGQGFTTTADTIVVLLTGGGAVVVGSTVKGCFAVIPSA